MKKLKNKVFWVIWAILTIFLFSILIIFNIQNYNQRVDNIKSSLMRMDESRNKEFNKDGEIPSEKMEPPEGSEIIEKTESTEIPKDTEISQNIELPETTDTNPQIFMDSTVYTVELDSDFNVINVINHTTNDVTDDEIKTIAENIIKNKGQDDFVIGNLYFTDYSYLFTRDNNSLVIMDNSSAKEELVQSLKTSILIFIVLEIAVIIVSKGLTNWIIKPVIETFDKQKQFIADASHELKTPLAVIIASSEALENSPDEKKWLTNIKSESERMNNLITDLLDMAKSENGVKEQFVLDNLSKIVEKSVLTFESLIYEKDVKLDYDIEENINLMCNGNQIKQVIGILMDNAIKHSESKGEIKVSLKKEKSNIVLKVTNKGKEIPKEEREKIFERFYRVDESRNRNENRYGLGLAIAKNIVTNHNGKISVSCENGYTTFKIMFK